jgi:serine/threonine protein kinase
MAHAFARRECSLHSMMDHPNIIKLYDYAENNNEYSLFMEYADRGDYLCQKILDVQIQESNHFIEAHAH